MQLTTKLKAWLVANVDGITKDTSEDDMRTAAGTAMATGKLTPVKFAELIADPKAAEANAFVKRLDGLTSTVDKLVTSLTKAKDDKDGKKMPQRDDFESDKEFAAAMEAYNKGKDKDGKAEDKDDKDGKSAPSRLSKMVASMGGMPVETQAGKTFDVRVKAAVEQYSTTKSALTYPERTKSDRPHSFAGQRVTDMGRALDSPSEKDEALAGVWAKFQILSVTPKIAGSPQRAWEMMNEHEKSLLCHLTEYEDWDASQDGKQRHTKGYSGVEGGRGIKQLIDDATSGGLEAAPIVFDDQVIQAPLLNGELFPKVNVQPLSRGRRVEGVSTGTVTGSWGGVDDTAITLFTTTSYVSAFDTTIFRWEGAIRIGLDFLSDTPIDFGKHITQQYGERMLEDLDDVIAVGNGTTQPEGVINATGVTTVAWGGATSLGNYESLRFGVAKPEHKGNVKNSACFCGTETSYQRARALPVGAADARRLGGMDYDNYTWMQRPFGINESLTNAQIFYAILARYRMYRRKGLAIRTTTEGDTLVRRNEMLIVAMARYGGQLERGAAAAITTTAPA